MSMQSIVVPAEGLSRFTVTGRGTLFRLTVSTPSGGTIGEPTIQGPAALLRTSEIIQLGPSGDPLIGALVREFEFRGVGAGDVTIDIRRTTPTSPMPVVERFEVTVK